MPFVSKRADQPIETFSMRFLQATGLIKNLEMRQDFFNELISDSDNYFGNEPIRLIWSICELYGNVVGTCEMFSHTNIQIIAPKFNELRGHEPET